MGKKIRSGTTRKIPINLIVGEQEAEQNTVTMRRYGIEDQPVLALDTFVSELRDEIRDRVDVRRDMR